MIMMGIFKNETILKNILTNKIGGTYSAQLSFQSSLFLSVVVKDDPEYISYHILLLYKSIVISSCLLSHEKSSYNIHLAEDNFLYPNS